MVLVTVIIVPLTDLPHMKRNLKTVRSLLCRS